MLENVIAEAPAPIAEERSSSARDYAVELAMPTRRLGIVVLTDGTPKCRTNPRDRLVARLLRERGLGTMLVDVVEGCDRATAVCSSVDWLLGSQVEVQSIGLFGRDEGIELATEVASRCPLQAVVLRGTLSRTASDRLASLSVPTLLIVGAQNAVGLQRGGDAQLGPHVRQLEIVPGTGEKFDEPGTLVAASLCAANWFRQFFPATESSPTKPEGRAVVATGDR